MLIFYTIKLIIRVMHVVDHFYGRGVLLKSISLLDG